LAGYANARDILPKTLLREVQRHFPGGLLWIPPPQRRRFKTRGLERRNQRLARDAREGLSLRDLSRKYGLSAERVRQLLKARQEKS
jgi:Mor family transcriptional regulator